MRTDEFTRLVPPQTAQVTIDPTPKDCPSDGFNYPTFRLLNKQERVRLSPKPLTQDPAAFYNLLAVANSKRWFVAATTQEDGSHALIASPLADLRAACKSKTAKDADRPFEPQRTLSLQSAKPSNLAFAAGDTRLFVASERGELLVFDTNALFSAGTAPVAPLQQLPAEAGRIRHIVPNPGAEANLADLVAVVYENRTVVLFDSRLEVQGGWIAGSPEDDAAPVAAAWSPKGKHIAIALQSGHILTYPLTNRSAIHRHIPPTAPPPLVSLTWLAPGHTFRTAYAPPFDPTQHIIAVDAKNPDKAVYCAPAHPFPLPERPVQSFTLVLPRWEQEQEQGRDTAGAATDTASLVVVGDRASTDLEVLAGATAQWHHQSQENPLALPLDANMEDTVLLALAVDLTDEQAGGVPVVLAYVSDGTVQAWGVERASGRPYGGMVGAQAGVGVDGVGLAQPAAPQTPPAFGSSGFGQQQASPFGQQAKTAPFGGATTAAPFGQPQGTSPFGQPQSASPFGGATTASPFGQAAPATTSPFGSTTTASPFGQPQSTSPFGQPSGAFGGGSSPSTFGSTAFGAPTMTNAFGAGAFGSLNNNNNNKNAFGQPSFGFGGAAAPAPAPDMSREASMSDSTTPSLGGMALGEPNDPSKPVKSGGIFGSLPPASASTSTTTAFSGGLIKPATGFGAFSNTPAPSDQKPASTTSGAFGAAAPKPPSGFGQSSFGQPGFGQTAFGQTAFGQTAFGQTAFGQTAFGKPAVPAATTTAPISGGFGAFASAPTSFSAAATQQPASRSTDAAAPTTTASDQKPASTTSVAFGPAPSKSPSGFGQSSFGTSSFGQPGFGQTAFGKPAVPAATTTPPVSGGFGAFASAPTSFSAAATSPGTGSAAPTGGFASFASSNNSPGFGAAATTTTTAPAPAAGFGAFGSGAPSAFGRASPQASNVSPFSAGAPRETSTFGSGGSTTSAFGSSGFTASPFGPQPGARAASPTQQTRTTAKPPALADSPLSSPESTPRLGKTSIIADNESPPPPPAPGPSTTPVSSPFGKFTAPSTGAFGNLQTSPSAFKPASGFGAFGGDTTPASSPFFKASTEQKTPPVSAFASSALPNTKAPTTTTTTTTPTSLAFGASSPLGGVRSAFAPVTPSPPPANAPATGGFGAFSGSSGGFGAFAGPKKSFGELLKTGDGDSTDPVKPKTGTTTSGAVKLEEEPKPVSAFPPIGKGSSGSVFSPPAPKIEEAEKEGSSSEKGKGVENQHSSSEERSFGNLSLLSEGSSFAEVEREESDNDVRSGSEDADGEAQVDYDEEGSFLSEEESEDEEGGLVSGSEESSLLSDVPEEEEGEDGEEVPTTTPTDPTVVPLPESRSASATPQPEVPKIKVTPSPPLEEKVQAREESTTPPGTPTKEPSPPLTRPASAPASSTSTSFGFGLGRPSTRPTRSSPLASVPVSLTDEDEALQSPVKPLASPQPRVAPLPLEVPLKTEEDDKASSARPPRPQTPPLLSAFGTKKPEVPSTPATPPTPSTPAQSATPTFSLFGKLKPSTLGTPSEAVSPPPLKPLANATLPKPVTSPVPAPPPTGFGLFGTLPLPSAGTAQPLPPAALPAPGPFNLGTFSLKGKAPEQPSPFTPPTQASTSPPKSISASGPATSIPPGFPSTVHAGPAPSPPPFKLSGFSLQAKTPATPGTSPQAPAAPPPFDLSGFSLKGKQPVGITTPPTAGAAPQGPTEAGMQRECVLVVNSTNEELAHLGRLAEQRKKQLDIIKARTGGRQRADLFDIKKWSPARAVMYGEVLVQFEKDLDELRDLRETQRQTIREFQSSMLKANTRKEEISRFNKAKNDKEFARMLKARTLGPEHLETQTQLRRNIRAMRDRIQKLEDHLKGSKKRLTQVKTGQPGLRAPSLDTINRTYRNIDLAIKQQSNDVASLKKRISKLSLSTPPKSPSSNGAYSASLTRDARLPDPTPRPYNVTPNVAITTAAALNAERAAQKLKRALLAVRKEPLLNTRAASAPPAPLSFATPQKPATDFFKIPPSMQLFPTTPIPIPGPSKPPAWDMAPDDDNFSPTSSPLMGGRRGATAPKKHNVITLKKAGATSPPPPPPSTFSWGPLPKFDYGKGESFSMVQAVKLTPPGKASERK